MGEDLKEKGESDACKCSRRGFEKERAMGYVVELFSLQRMQGSVSFKGSGDLSIVDLSDGHGKGNWNRKGEK